MLRDFDLPRPAWPPRTAVDWAIYGVATLALLNVAALYFVWNPPGGSAEDLEKQTVNMRADLLKRRAVLERTRRNVAKVEAGRVEGDRFMGAAFLNERTAYSNVLGELTEAARAAKVTPKEHSFTPEPIEGSDSLAMMTINANYEAKYTDLMTFINSLDRSKQLVIIESLAATPQTGAAGMLNVNMKLDAFVRDPGAAQ